MIRAYLAEQMDAVEPGDLTCEIDGRPVADILSYRCSTPAGEAFMVDLPENDVWGIVGTPIPDDGVLEPGLYGPSIQDGIFVMVAPLAAGEHIIRFTAGDFLDVTYNLTVLK